MEIDKKYRTYIRGTYNNSVDICPNCGNKMFGTIFENSIGIATDAYGQYVMIIVCNECFEKFYFHCDITAYKCLVNTIKQGKNLHFNIKHDE